MVPEKRVVKSPGDQLAKIRTLLESDQTVDVRSDSEAAPEAKKEEQFFDASEADEIEAAKKRNELERDNLKLQEEKNRLDDKQKFGDRLYYLSVSWLIAIFITIWASSIEWNYPVNDKTWDFWKQSISFKLSDTVLTVLIGTTTANVLGLLYIVANHLFPSSKVGAPKPGNK